MLSARRIAQMYKETRPFFKKHGFKDAVPAQFFDTNELAAAAIPATEFFDRGPGNAICNLEQPNEFPNPVLVLAMGLQVFGTIADVITVSQHTEVEFEKDQRKWTSYPSCAVPGGGGVNAAISTTVAAITQSATQGLGNSFRRFKTPIAVEQKQAFRCWMQSDGTAVAAITGVRIVLECIEIRRIV